MMNLLSVLVLGVVVLLFIVASLGYFCLRGTFYNQGQGQFGKGVWSVKKK